MAKKAKDDQLKIDLFGNEPVVKDSPDISIAPARVKLDLRDYQIEGVVRFQIWWDSPELEALIALTMGMGKTITASACANHFFEKINPSGKILWLTHRDELVDQSKDELELYTGKTCEIEQADQRYSGLSQILVASVATLRGKRLQKLAEEFIPDLIICDEAHHALAMSWMHIKQTFPKAKVLNLTATPFRSDIGNRLDLGTILLEKNTTEGIKMGVLVPPKPVGKLEINMGVVKKRLGDYDLNSLSEMMCHEDVMKACVDLICQNAKGHKSLLFAATVEHGNLVSAELRKAGFKVGEIYGYTDKTLRKEMPGKLDRGELDIIVNNLCLDEQTEIMTKNGWRNYKTIQQDDLVANWEHGHIWFAKPKKIILRDRKPGERMIVNSTQGVRVTEGHRMLVKEHGVYRHRQSQTLVGKTYEFPVSGKSKIGRSCSLSLINCRLAGHILGEGHGADTLASLLCQLPGDNRGNILPWRKIAAKTSRLGAFLTLMHSFTDRQFSAFLSGFWESCHQKNASQPPGRIAIQSSDYDMLSSIQIVACCRGYSAELINLGHNWRLSLIKKRTYKFTDTQTLEVEAIPQTTQEKVWCVSTPSSNIITRRNGFISILGNCLTEGFNLPSIDMVIMMRPTKNAALYLQCIGRGLRKDPANPLKTHCYIIDVVDTAKRKGGISCPLPTDDDVRMYSAMVGRQASHPEVFLNWFYKANELGELVAGTRSVSALSRLDEASKVYKLLAPPWMAAIQNNPASDILKVIWTQDASYKDLLKPHRINDTDAFCLMMSRKGWAYLPHGKLPTTEEQLAETEAASVPDSDTNYTLATLISQDAQLRNFIMDLFDPNQSLQEQAKKCYDCFELGSKEVAWFKLINRSDVSFHFIQWKEDDTNIILARTPDEKIYWFQQIGRNKLTHVPGRDLYFSQLPDFAKGTNWANQPMSDKQSTHVAKILGVTVQEAVTARISKLSASALMSNSWNKAHIKNIATQLGNLSMLKPVVFKDDSLPKIDMDDTLAVETPGVPVEAAPVPEVVEPVTTPSASEGVINGDEPF